MSPSAGESADATVCPSPQTQICSSLVLAMPRPKCGTSVQERRSRHLPATNQISMLSSTWLPFVPDNANV